MSKHQQYLLLSLFFVVAMSSCNGKVNRMAGDMCTCMQPMAETYANIERMAAANDSQGLEQLMAKMETLTTEVDSCMDKLEAAYGDALEKSESQIRTVMTKRCPDVARVMEAAESAF